MQDGTYDTEEVSYIEIRAYSSMVGSHKVKNVVIGITRRLHRSQNVLVFDHLFDL